MNSRTSTAAMAYVEEVHAEGEVLLSLSRDVVQYPPCIHTVLSTSGYKEVREGAYVHRLSNIRLLY